jgi:hypothetical protein
VVETNKHFTCAESVPQLDGESDGSAASATRSCDTRDISKFSIVKRCDKNDSEKCCLDLYGILTHV